MPKVYSVDSILDNNRPYVQLRGRYYEVRDISVRERLKKIDEFKRKQQEEENKIGKNEEDIKYEDIQSVIAEAIQTALVGVPDEVAESVTQSEWKVLQNVLADIHAREFPVESEDVDEIDENLVGPE